MKLKKEQFEALIERESIADFIWIRSWKDIPNTNIGLFELENDRWGCIFQIKPSVYAGHGDAEKKLASFYNTIDIPGGSSIQFVSFASRNLTAYMDVYKNIHSEMSNVENREALNELREHTIDWIKKHSNENIFSQGNDLRLRNFMNLVAVTIPRKKTKDIDYTESEIISYFSKIEQTINDFKPTKFTSREWVILMREILIPDNPLWFPPDDRMTMLNYQVVNNDSIMTLEENAMGLGSMISKQEYMKLLEEQNLKFKEDDIEDENENLFSKLFKKKKKKEDLMAYTKWKAKTYTTKMFPHTVNMADVPLKFYDYLGTKISPNIPCPFFLSLIVYFEDREEMKKEVSDKAKWDMYQTNNLGDAVRFFPEVRDRGLEAEAINEMVHNGRMPMYASWSCTIMDSSESNVMRYGENLKNAFNASNWILQEETLIPHWVFLYHLPLNFEPYVLKDLAKRMNILFSNNCASITPLVTGESGYGNPTLVYTDRGGQLSGCDIFSSQTNFNFIVIGDSGSGKSYNMADFFKNYLMTGAKIRVIDVGRSYAELCTTIGGQYIEFTEEANICLNFFTNIQLDEDGNIHEDELQTIVPLIGLMAMQSVDSDTTNDMKIPVIKSRISEAVIRAFKSRQRNAGMQDVVEALEQIAIERKNETGEYDQLLADLTVALYPFGHPDGEYYKYFNGDNNLQFVSDFVVIELEEIDAKKHLKSVVLAAISHVINTEFFLSGDRKQSKILAIDEAWSIMDNRTVMQFIETVARRIRKYRGALGIITQNIADFKKNAATKAIFDTSAWKFYLEQSPDSLAAAQNSGDFHFGQTELYLLGTIKKRAPYYSEILIKNSSSGGFFVARLITDPVSHWIYTNAESDKKEIYKLMEKYNISSLEARMIIGSSYKNKTTEHEEYVKRLSEGKILSA